MNRISMGGTVISPPKLVQGTKKQHNVIKFSITNKVLNFKVSCKGELADLVDKKVSIGTQILVFGEVIPPDPNNGQHDGYILANEIYLVREGLKLA